MLRLKKAALVTTASLGLLALPYSINAEALTGPDGPDFANILERNNLVCAEGSCAADCGCGGGSDGCCVLPNGAVCLMTIKEN